MSRQLFMLYGWSPSKICQIYLKSIIREGGTVTKGIVIGLGIFFIVAILFSGCGKYRTAKRDIQNDKLATFTTTNKGTIATLTDTRVFDINIEGSDKQNAQEATSKTTTNKKVFKNLKDICANGFDVFWKEYPKKKDKKRAFTTWVKISPSEQLQQQILSALQKQKQSKENMILSLWISS